MMLEAAEQGLDSVWICYFKPDVISSEFDLPQGWHPVNLLAVGYGTGPAPSPDCHRETRKPLAALYEGRNPFLYRLYPAEVF